MDYLTPGLARSKLMLAGAMVFTSLDGQILYANFRGFFAEFPLNSNGDIFATRINEFLTLCKICPREELTERGYTSRIVL